VHRKKISIWGATGSIGRQTLEVIKNFKEHFEILVLTAHQNVNLILQQAEIFHPKTIVITGNVDVKKWKQKIESIEADFLWGEEGLLEMAASGKEDLIVNALVGAVGLRATMHAVEAGTSIALANKEVLVMAGEIVSSKIEEKGVHLFPIDSEHSAIFQCLQGEDQQSVKRIFLTASGGPFLYRDKLDFDCITLKEALSHPNWSMGNKVTIDSATLMNKGLEVIEARWLFGLKPDQIAVLIHPQSIVHSMVEFRDGSVKAQLGAPDMRIPIAYALTYPERWTGNYKNLDLIGEENLEFMAPDMEKFPSLRLAYEVLEVGGTAPAVLNGADEVAVNLFVSGKIGFNQIHQLVEKALGAHHVKSDPDLNDILQADTWVRTFLLEYYKS
jgi:1-deoxy-D-xylulose-5-phosphate reductoisomerase